MNLHDHSNNAETCENSTRVDLRQAKIIRSVLVIFPIFVLLIIVLTVDFLLYQKRHRAYRREHALRENWDTLYHLEVKRLKRMSTRMGFGRHQSHESLDEKLDFTYRPSPYNTVTSPLLSPFSRWIASYDVENMCDMCEIEKPHYVSSIRHMSKSTNDVCDSTEIDSLLTSNNNLQEVDNSSSIYRTSSR